MSKKQFSRRAFLKSGSMGLAALGAAAAGPLKLLSKPLSGLAGAGGSGKVNVIVAQKANAINNRNQANQAVVSEMFNKSLFSLTGKSNAAKAWASLGLTPKDVVAVKINCNTWTIQLSPHLELVKALCDSLSSVIPANQIIFYERTTSDLQRGGFKSNTSNQGIRYFGNDEGGGYHPKELLTRIVTDTATKIINLASLKCVEGDFGASLFFKNHIGTLRDRDMPKCHSDLDFLAEVNARPSIKNKTLLNICDGLRGTYRRGVPWYWGGIVMGQDPVASEYAVIRVINEKRKQENISPIDTPQHLLIAQKKYNLGVCTPGKIQIKQI